METICKFKYYSEIHIQNPNSTHSHSVLWLFTVFMPIYLNNKSIYNLLLIYLLHVPLEYIHQYVLENTEANYLFVFVACNRKIYRRWMLIQNAKHEMIVCGKKTQHYAYRMWLLITVFAVNKKFCSDSINIIVSQRIKRLFPYLIGILALNYSVIFAEIILRAGDDNV